MNPLRTYDYLELARRRVLDWARPLTVEERARVFPIGLGTLARTLTHMVVSEWYYVERLTGRDVPPQDRWPIRDEEPPEFEVLERAWVEQAARTRAAVRAVRDWDVEIEYRVNDDEGRETIVNASAADIFTQLVLHEVHHRAQAMNILRQLGVAAADVDFNALMYKRRLASRGAS